MSSSHVVKSRWFGLRIGSGTSNTPWLIYLLFTFVLFRQTTRRRINTNGKRDAKQKQRSGRQLRLGMLSVAVWTLSSRNFISFWIYWFNSWCQHIVGMLSRRISRLNAQRCSTLINKVKSCDNKPSIVRFISKMFTFRWSGDNFLLDSSPRRCFSALLVIKVREMSSNIFCLPCKLPRRILSQFSLERSRRRNKEPTQRSSELCMTVRWPIGPNNDLRCCWCCYWRLIHWWWLPVKFHLDKVIRWIVELTLEVKFVVDVKAWADLVRSHSFEQDS